VAESQQGVRSILARAFEDLGYRTIFIPGRSSGGQLYATPRNRVRGRRTQLLLGHHDTVWPLGTLETMPFSVEDDIVKGPGVYDMKGGLTQTVLALRTLAQLDLEPAVTPVVFINSDEEIGSRESTRHIRTLARQMNRVFVLEPSLGLAGHIKTTRKGVGRFTVKVKGKAAHAGLDADRGVSAILELSHVIQELFSLNDSEKGITVNVGTIDGGLRPNVIAPESKAVVDVRVQTHKDAMAVERAIHSLQPSIPGTQLEVEGGIGRPALEATPRNQALWHLAKELGREIGLELDDGLAGGGSDGNTTSQFTATLDGLGAVGDGAHAHHEFLSIEKTLERTALLALLLLLPPLNMPESDLDTR
jgi:glutamate carboxypeptidase